MNQDEGAQTSQGCGGMDIAQPAQDPQGCAGMDIEGNNSPTILTSPVPGVEKPNPGCGPIDPVPTKTDTAHETPEDFTHQYFEAQKDDTSGKEGDLSNVDVTFREDNRTHIFDDRPGHLIDTPENREKIINLVKNPENFVTKDRHGKLWFGKILPNGTQLWAHVVKGVVTNCGLNATPLESDPAYGYSNPNKPKQK